MKGAGSGVSGLGSGVWGLGSGVWGLGSGVWGLGLGLVVGCGVWGMGCANASVSVSVSAAASATVSAADGAGQVNAGAVVEVDYTNAGLTPSHWVLTLRPDGTGHFWSENSKRTEPPAKGEPPPAPVVDRDISVSAAYARHVFEEARSHRFFAEECESHMKVAFQGLKKLSYRGPDGQGSCGFNYSKDQRLQALGESLVAVAETIVEGSRLDWLLRYDPLGLDHEMEYVVDGSGDGRLQEIGTIRGILERLAGDEGVLDRVRKRARTLLARTQG